MGLQILEIPQNVLAPESCSACWCTAYVGPHEGRRRSAPAAKWHVREFVGMWLFQRMHADRHLLHTRRIWDRRSRGGAERNSAKGRWRCHDSGSGWSFPRLHRWPLEAAASIVDVMLFQVRGGKFEVRFAHLSTVPICAPCSILIRVLY